MPPLLLNGSHGDAKSETERSYHEIVESGKASLILDPVDEPMKDCKDVVKCGKSCQETLESGKERRVLDLADEEALEQRKGIRKLRGSCLEIAGSGNEKQVLNSVEEETCFKKVHVVGEESCQETLKSVEEKVVECCKEVDGGLRLMGGDFKEKLDQVILYRRMLEESSSQMRDKEVIEKELTFRRFFTRALTEKGGKLINRIIWETRVNLIVIRSFEAREKVVLRGLNKMVNKAELMLEEISSSAVEISVSDEEREVLLSGGGKKKVVFWKRSGRGFQCQSGYKEAGKL